MSHRHLGFHAGLNNLLASQPNSYEPDRRRAEPSQVSVQGLLGYVEAPQQESLAVKYFTTKELARRWTLSHRTLENWRQADKGPRWVKLGSRIVYPLSEIIAYEVTHFNGGAK